MANTTRLLADRQLRLCWTGSGRPQGHRLKDHCSRPLHEERPERTQSRLPRVQRFMGHRLPHRERVGGAFRDRCMDRGLQQRWKHLHRRPHHPELSLAQRLRRRRKLREWDAQLGGGKHPRSGMRGRRPGLLRLRADAQQADHAKYPIPLQHHRMRLPCRRHRHLWRGRPQGPPQHHPRPGGRPGAAPEHDLCLLKRGAGGVSLRLAAHPLLRKHARTHRLAHGFQRTSRGHRITDLVHER